MSRRPLTVRKTYVQKTVHDTKREPERELARFVTEVGDGAHASTKSTSAVALHVALVVVSLSVLDSTLANYDPVPVRR